MPGPSLPGSVKYMLLLVLLGVQDHHHTAGEKKKTSLNWGLREVKTHMSIRLPLVLLLVFVLSCSLGWLRTLPASGSCATKLLFFGRTEDGSHGLKCARQTPYD